MALLDQVTQGTNGPPPADGTSTNSGTHVFPLSFAQQRLWFLDRIAPGNSFYNIPLALPVAGSLRANILARAINTIIERHESLRTTFQVLDGKPAQIVHGQMEVAVASRDLSALPKSQRDAAVTEIATAEARRPFDLECGPLVRCMAVRCGLFEHVILLSIHHIVADGWSVGVFLGELSALYQAYAAGAPDPLPPLAIQYPDFTLWQRDWLRDEVLEEQLEYWRAKLACLPVLDLPADRPRPSYATYNGAIHNVRMTPAVTAAVRLVAKRHNATPFMVLLAGFAAMLGRYASQDDVVIGAPLANRTRPETEDLIGFFVNSLVLRVDLGGDPSFEQLIDRVRNVALEAYGYQDLPFEKIVEDLQPARDPSRNPLFQVTFQLLNMPSFSTGMAANDAFRIEANRGSAIFDFALSLVDRPDAYAGLIEYSTDLFDASTIERMDAGFQRLLAAGLESPATPVSHLPLAGENDRRALLGAANAPETPPPQPVHLAIAAQARRTPGAVAVQERDAELTYAELWRNWRSLARCLARLGIGPGDRVGLLLDRSADAVTAMLAVLEAGAAYVPLDPQYPPGRLRLMTADAAIRAIVTAESHMALAEELVPDGGRAIDVSVAGAPSEDDEDWAPGALSGEDIAYVIYTSGSTGRPKGVAVPHRALGNHMAWMIGEFGFSSRTRILQRTSLSFDASIWELFAPLMTGGRLVVLPPEAGRDPEAIVRHCIDFDVTAIQVVPSLLRLLLKVPAFYNCASLRQIFSGGERLDDDLRDTVVNTLGVEFVNLYGPAEATIQATFFRAGAAAHPGSVPIGRPITGARAYVLDDRLEPLPTGVAGELYLGGACLARGYVGRPSATAGGFLPDPFADRPGVRMYRTGDRARLLADGDLQFVGRTDGQLKLHGFRVEPGEMEARIRQIPGVADCVILATDATEDQKSLAVFLIAETIQAADAEISTTANSPHERGLPGSISADRNTSFNTDGRNSSTTGRLPPLISAVREQLSTTLPADVVPSSLILLDAIPALPNGKRDEAQLRQHMTFGAEISGAAITPRTPLEKVLALLWAEVLDVGQIDVRDDFFATLGGHSLLATRLMARIRETLDVDLPLHLLFLAPTLEQFAAAIAEHESERLPEVVRRSELYVAVKAMRKAEIGRMLARDWSGGPEGAG